MKPIPGPAPSPQINGRVFHFVLMKFSPQGQEAPSSLASNRKEGHFYCKPFEEMKLAVEDNRSSLGEGARGQNQLGGWAEIRRLGAADDEARERRHGRRLVSSHPACFSMLWHPPGPGPQLNCQTEAT